MNNLFFVHDVSPWLTLAIALLIGALVGTERETGKTHIAIGLRDLILTSAIAWICGQINEPWLTAAVLLGIMALLVFQGRRDPGHIGITTEFSVIATFALSYAISLPGNENLIPVAIALAVALTFVLNVKEKLKAFFKESVTDIEFAATIRFLALIFIIYPLLPEGRYGPYDFFAPRSLWLAVILVSGVSYVGYFLEKFMGARVGGWTTAFLGGLVSTTATTSAIAGDAKNAPSRMSEFWRNVTISNAVQFGRLLVLVIIVAPSLTYTFMPPTLVALGVGFVFAFVVGRLGDKGAQPDFKLRNPLRMTPALIFAGYMAVIGFVSGVAFDWYGTEALYATSAIGSLLDVDAVTLSNADLYMREIIDASTMNLVVIIAVASNMIVKVGIALTNGNVAFMWRTAVSFLVMLSAYLVTILII